MKVSMRAMAVVFAVAAVQVPAAEAVVLTYTYTGGLFNMFFGYGHPADRLTGTVSFDVADPSLLNGRAFGAMPTASSWSISDGQRTRASDTWLGDALTFMASTDASGGITSWDLKLTAQGGALVAVASVPGSGDQSGDLTPTGGGTWTGGSVFALGPVGTWAQAGASAVPEPTSAALLAMGLTTIAGAQMVRTRRQRTRDLEAAPRQ